MRSHPTPDHDNRDAAATTAGHRDLPRYFAASLCLRSARQQLVVSLRPRFSTGPVIVGDHACAAAADPALVSVFFGDFASPAPVRRPPRSRGAHRRGNPVGVHFHLGRRRCGRPPIVWIMTSPSAGSLRCRRRGSTPPSRPLAGLFHPLPGIRLMADQASRTRPSRHLAQSSFTRRSVSDPSEWQYRFPKRPAQQVVGEFLRPSSWSVSGPSLFSFFPHALRGSRWPSRRCYPLSGLNQPRSRYRSDRSADPLRANSPFAGPSRKWTRRVRRYRPVCPMRSTILRT